MKKLLLCLALFLLAVPALATCGGGGGGGVGGIPPMARNPMGMGAEREFYSVPWKAALTGEPAPTGVLVLYWFPTSPADEKSSELQDSRPLTLAAAKCVALAVVRADNTELREKYKIAANASVAVLALAADGSEMARAQGKYGRPLGKDEVEKMVKDGIKRREKDADGLLDSARAKSDHGDKDGAVVLYTKVWEERCLAEKPAKKAAKELKKLGKPVPDQEGQVLPEPDWSPAIQKAVLAALSKGLAAENELRLADAQKAYDEAHRADPGDPVPLRYLGELYRHHLGDWGKAHETFQQILAMNADPLSRAVALHGLGKMTIHAGDFAKGLGMFEDSLRAYPLPLTYRNLAVYWSSEGDTAKAYGYVQKALAIAPEDEYTQIFAATFLVKLGKPEEAARIASEHESLLAASYNLAAIWAQIGQRDKALALLKRHFYTYEQFEDVRRKEMQEARVDIVFASLKADPAFVELTALADGAGMK